MDLMASYCLTEPGERQGWGGFDEMEWNGRKIKEFFFLIFFFQLFSNFSILLFYISVGSGSDASSLSTSATFDSHTNE
jgi:hypothetical protein